MFFLGVAWCGSLFAAPFNQNMTFTQPGGTVISFHGCGDEFYATFTYNGYSIVYDQPTRAYYYAKCSADGTTLELTDAKAGIDPVPVGVEPNEAGKVSPDVIHAQIDARRAEWEEKMGIRKGWEKIKADFHETQRKLESGQPVLMAAKYPETTGTRVGLTILVDFPDSPRSSIITSERIDQLLNGENCTLFGNVSSVRSYYHDVSNGKLDYSNLVIPYVRVARKKSEYNAMSQNGAWVSFFTDIFTALREKMEEDEALRAQLLEQFGQLTLTDGDVVRCFNVWYAGEPDVGWSQGLWPASGPIGTTLTLPFSNLKVSRAQMSNLGSAPSIYVFCHENGHMMCDYPDFYDYQYDSTGGAGAFCLMSSRLAGSDQNPPVICAPLRYLSGWTTPVKISKFQSKAFEVKSSSEGWDAQNTIYIYENKSSTDADGHVTEYYLIENRQKSGRDATIPASGIAIWHVDELGDTDDQRYAYNTQHNNYEATLIQADGNWDFEHNRNEGDMYDLWYEENRAPGYVNAFTSMTDYDPSSANRGTSSRWWSGQPTGLNIIRFSGNGSVMTFETQGLSPTISNRNMKNGRVGSPYRNVFTAVNAEGTQTWSIAEGELPDGLQLEEDGVLGGVPMEDGEFTICVLVRAEGQAASNTFAFAILPQYELPYEESFTNDAPDSTWGWFEEDDPMIATDDGTDEDPELDDGEPDDGEPDDDEGFDLGGDPDGDGDGDGDGEPDDGDPDAGDEPDEPEEEPEEDSIYYSGLSWTVRNGNANNGGYPDGAKSAPFCLSFATNRLPQKVLSLSSNVIETVTDEEGNATVKTNKVKYSETRTLYPRKLISTPMLDFTGHRRVVVSFNLINRKRSGRQDELRVYYRTSYDDEWILLESYTNSVQLWTAQEIVLPEEAMSDTAYIGFEGTLYGGYGIHIDDVVISDPTTELMLGDVALEEAIIGVPYEVQIPVTGGVQPYTWELDGDLPDGLSFTNGVIFGTPTTEETCTFTVTVSDEDEVETASQTYTLVVDLPHVTVWQETFDHASGEMPTDWTQECVEESLRWVAYSGSPSHVPNASVEGMYNAALYWHDYVTGERTNHITRLITPLVDFGENPSKLALNFWLCMRDRYNLSTTPRDQDELRVYFKANADDAWGDPIAVYTNSVDWWTFQKVPLSTDYTSGYFCFEGNAKAGYGICIDDVRVVDATDCPIVITKSPLPSAYATAPYSVTLQATGGEGEYIWDVDEDDLPPGLELSENGVLSGTPTRTGTYYFDVTVADEAGNSSSRTLSVTFLGGIKPSKFVGTFDEGMDWESWSVVNEKAIGWVFTNGSAPRERHEPIPNAAYEGNTNALLFFNGTSVRYVSRLTTPMIDFSGATNVTLSFWLCKAAYSGNSDELYIDYRTNYEGTATTLMAITTNVSEWTQYTVELPDPSATTFITFRGKTRGGYGIALDDVTFDVQREEPELTVYQQWKLDRLEDADYGDDEDCDEDGLSTKEEFVFGADPTSEDYEAALLDIWIDEGIAYVSFREGVAALEYGVVFELQSCSDLALGDWTSEGMVLVDTDDTEDDYYEVIYTYGDGDIAVTPQRFFRLKVIWPDDEP